jgi:steroid delta-isomerase-like uncharacterized protein
VSIPVAVLARRWFEEVWNQKRDDTMEQILSPNCAGFMEGQGEIIGAEMFKAVRVRLLDAFPDLSVLVEDTVAEGTKAVVRWVARATHRGAGLGLAPTGLSCEFRGVTWLEFEDGRLVRGWSHWDHGGLLQKLQRAEPRA